MLLCHAQSICCVSLYYGKPCVRAGTREPTLIFPEASMTMPISSIKPISPTLRFSQQLAITSLRSQLSAIAFVFNQ